MPILFLLLAVPIGEIFVLIEVGSVVGFLRTFLYLVLMVFLGSALIKAQGRDLMLKAQTTLSRGEIPAGSSLHGMLGILAGILFVIPGIISDIVALLCILPGSKHLIALLMRKWMAKQIAKGQMHVFGKMGGGAGGFGGFGGGFGGPPPGGFGTRPGERDVSPKVIDITPIKSDSTDGKN